MSRSNKHRIIWIMFVVIFLYMPETEIFKQFNCLQNNIFCYFAVALLLHPAKSDYKNGQEMFN